MRYSWILTTSTIFISTALARGCRTDSLGLNQTVVDRQLLGCTSLLYLYIPNDYQGALNLSGIKNISDLVWTTKDQVGLTELYLDDLENLGGLDIRGGNLEKITLPKLKNVETLYFYNITRDLDIDLPNLVKAENISVIGRAKGFNAPLLYNVSRAIVVNADYPYMYSSKQKLGPSSKALPFALEMPSLEYGSKLEVRGNFTSIAFPKLSTLGPFESDGSLRLETNSTMDISFPVLQSANSFDLSSKSFISFPALANVGNIRLETSEDSSIIFPLLERAKKLVFQDAITSVSLPRIKSVDSVQIYNYASKSPDCDTITADFLRMYNLTSKAELTACISRADNPCGDLRCNENTSNNYRYSTPPGLSTMQIAAIASGAGFGGFFLLLGLFLWYRTKRHKRQEQRAATERENHQGYNLGMVYK